MQFIFDTLKDELNVIMGYRYISEHKVWRDSSRGVGFCLSGTH